MRRLALPVALVLASACEIDPVASSSEAIIGGEPFSDLPAIGAMLYDGGWGCSATLIGPRRVLTAAHCLLRPGGQPYPPARLAFAVGPDATAPEQVFAVAALRVHPAYDGVRAGNDIGVVVLAETAPIQPIALVDRMDDGWIGRDLLLVGYGATDGSGADGGIKRAVWSAIDWIGPRTFRYGDASANTCWGDSGGPALVEDAAGDGWRVAGTTSLGDAHCQVFAADTRVDVHRDFVDPPPPASAGPVPDPPAAWR